MAEKWHITTDDKLAKCVATVRGLPYRWGRGPLRQQS